MLKFVYDIGSWSDLTASRSRGKYANIDRRDQCDPKTILMAVEPSSSPPPHTPSNINSSNKVNLYRLDLAFKRSIIIYDFSEGSLVQYLVLLLFLILFSASIMIHQSEQGQSKVFDSTQSRYG